MGLEDFTNVTSFTNISARHNLRNWGYIVETNFKHRGKCWEGQETGAVFAYLILTAILEDWF